MVYAWYRVRRSLKSTPHSSNTLHSGAVIPIYLLTAYKHVLFQLFRRNKVSTLGKALFTSRRVTLPCCLDTEDSFTPQPNSGWAIPPRAIQLHGSGLSWPLAWSGLQRGVCCRSRTPRPVSKSQIRCETPVSPGFTIPRHPWSREALSSNNKVYHRV